MDSPDEPRTFSGSRLGSSPDRPGWVDGAPTSGIGQACAFCGTLNVAWVHRLARDRLTYRQYGKGHTLPSFWALCDRCEGVYASGDDDGAIELMRTNWPYADDEDVAECIRKPLAVFRRADLGSRRVDPEPPSVVEARKQGFLPLREVTGIPDTLGPLWPEQHRLWLDELGPSPVEDAYDEVLDRWLVRSPWPALSIDQTLGALWRSVERDPFPYENEAWEARVFEVFGWSESEALAFANPEH
jgi:hypothetical protein